jgi:hypothetical protein
MRPSAQCAASVGRKNWTVAGSDEGRRRAVAMFALIETAKLNDIDPRVWLADTLARVPDHPAARVLRRGLHRTCTTRNKNYDDASVAPSQPSPISGRRETGGRVVYCDAVTCTAQVRPSHQELYGILGDEAITRLISEPLQITPIGRLAIPSGQAPQLIGSNKSLRECNLLRAADQEPLPMLDGADELRSLE